MYVCGWCTNVRDIVQCMCADGVQMVQMVQMVYIVPYAFYSSRVLPRIGRQTEKSFNLILLNGICPIYLRISVPDVLFNRGLKHVGVVLFNREFKTNNQRLFV